MAIVLGVMVGIPLLVLSYIFSDLCKNEVRAQYPAPDGRLKLVVFGRDCGATTGFSAQASLLDGNGDLPDEAGNVFVADTGEIRVRWDGPRKLFLSYAAGSRVFHQEKESHGVEIRYGTFMTPEEAIVP